MGRSFLSVKLAAVFGLLVAAVVTVQQQQVARGAAVEWELAPARAAVEAQRAERRCEEESIVFARTARAMAREAAAAAAVRS